MKVLDKEFELFITAKEIDKHVKKLAKTIEEDYKGKTPVFLVVLNGAFIFAADLVRQYPGNCKLSFMRLSSYEGTKSSGQIKKHIEAENLRGQDVIITEDIVDTGNSLEFILDYLEKQNVKSKSIVSMFHKPDAYKKPYPIDYIGMNIPDKFILGYGLDYDGYGRNLPDIYQLKTS
jgi:hypoxanthine phosphoribosyltransferase